MIIKVAASGTPQKGLMFQIAEVLAAMGILIEILELIRRVGSAPGPLALRKTVSRAVIGAAGVIRPPRLRRVGGYIGFGNYARWGD
jgi:hypothetical protein